MGINPGSGLSDLLSQIVKVNSDEGTMWGTIKGIGAGTVDVLPDGGAGLFHKKRCTGGTPVIGARAKIYKDGDNWVVEVPTTMASSPRAAGLVIMAGNGVGGSGSAYPLPHAPSHGAGGPDPLTPGDIGAATPAYADGLMAAHLSGDPHTIYLPITGVRPMAGALTTRAIKAHLPNSDDIGEALVPFRKAFISEMDTVRFVENAVSVVSGILVVPALSGTLAYPVVAADTTINFGTAMTPGHFVMLSAAGQVEYLLVGALSVGTLYSVTRDLDGTGPNDWPDGAVWVDLGYNGTGRIALDDTSGEAKLSILLQGSTYDAVTEVVRLGQMNGAFGIATDVWGLGVGDYLAGNYMLYDTGSGFRLKAGDDAVSIDEDGILLLAGPAYNPKNEVKFVDGSARSVLAMGAQIVGSGDSFSAWLKAGEGANANGYGSLLTISSKGKDPSGTGTYARTNMYGGIDMSAAPQIDMSVYDTGVGSTHAAGTTHLKVYGDKVTLDNPLEGTVVRASGDVFALGKGTGIQAQVLDNHIYYVTALVYLTTSWLLPTGLSVAHTPAVNEIAEITAFISFAQHAGTNVCTANDQLVATLSLYYSGADHGFDEKGVYATGGTGSQGLLLKAYTTLTAGVAYTIRVLAKNNSGARGLVDYASWMDIKYRAA